MAWNSAFEARDEYEIMLKLSMYFLLHFLQDRGIFFQPFLLMPLLFTQKLIEKLWNGTMANVNSLAKSQEIYLRFLCRLVWLKLLLITYQIREKHFVRNQEYWNEDWNKSSNGEWTLQGINMGVLLSIWRREFLGIPFRNIFIIYMKFKPCPWRLFTTTSRTVSFHVAVSFQFRFICHHSNALYVCLKAMSIARRY